MKKGLLTMAGVLLTVSLVSAGTTVPVLAKHGRLSGSDERLSEYSCNNQRIWH